MKKLSLILCILSVFVLFTGCANSNSSSDSTVVFKGEQGVVGYGDRILTHTYGSDGIMTINVQNPGESPRDTLRGPYDGDPSKDGTLTFTLNEEKNSSGEWVARASVSKKTVTITDGKYKYGGITMTRQ